MADFRLTRRKPQDDGPRAAVAPDPAVSASLLSRAGGHAMSGLHSVGSILSWPSRVLWGTVSGLSGHGFGNQSLLDSTGGIELSHVLGNAGVIAKNDPNKWQWGDLGRGLVDIAGDPTSWIAPLGLTRAGVQASKLTRGTAGALEHGVVNQIRAGQRGLVGLTHPLGVASHGAIGTGSEVADAVHGIGTRTGAFHLSRRVAESAPVTKIKELFNASAMGRTTPATQAAAEHAYEDIGNRLHDTDLGAINAARNIQARGPIGGDVERHLAEIGTPTREMQPLLRAKDALHAEAQSLGIPTGDLQNTVKAFTKVGPQKALTTKVLDHSGNVVHTIVNQGSHQSPVNYLVPNTAVQHVPRFAGEGVEWGGLGAEHSSKAMTAQSAVNQQRNTELFGNAPTSIIEEGVRAAAGVHPRLAAAGLSENQQARVIGKLLKRTVIAKDIAAGTNLTKKTTSGTVHGVPREIDRTRELGQFIQKNPQVAETGLFTNDPVFDTHRQMTALSNTIPKAHEAIHFMAQHALPNHGETLDALRRNGLDNPPTVRNAAEQLGINADRVGEHVLNQLPRPLAAQLGSQAAAEAMRRAVHTMQGQPGQAIARAAEQLQPGILHQMVLDLHLPSNEYKSLTGFLDKPKPTKEGVLSSLNTMWKANMLSHPATQTRNAVSATVTNALQGAASPSSMKHAVDLIRGNDVAGYSHVPEVAHLMSSQNINETEALRRLAAVHFPVNQSITGDLPAGQAGAQLENVVSNVPGKTHIPASEAFMGPVKALVGLRDGTHVGTDVVKPWAIGGAFGREQTGFGPVMASNMVAQNVEQSQRIGGWLGLLQQGYSPQEAARLVGKAQVNYGGREFSETEKKIKKLIPFYAFSSRAAKHVATELATSPGGRMAQLVKAQDRAHAQDASTPDSVLSGTALPLGQSEDGTKRYLTGFGLAHEPAVHTLGALAGGDFRGAGYDVLGMLNPLLSKPLEHVTNQSFFQRGEPAGNLDPNIGRLLSNVAVMAGVRHPDAGPVKFPGSSMVEPVVAASPLSRVIGTAKTLTDTRKDVVDKLVNTLSGAKITDVSPQKQEYQLRKVAERIAVSAGAKARSDVYFSKDELATLQKTNPSLAQRQMELQKLLAALKSNGKKNKQPKQSDETFRLSRSRS